MVRLKNRREISSCQIKTSRKRNLAKILCRKQKRGGYKRRVWEVYIMANLFSILFIILVAIVGGMPTIVIMGYIPVSYTHLRGLSWSSWPCCPPPVLHAYEGSGILCLPPL